MTMIDYQDRCTGCGAPFYPAHGAFGCGYPSADCPAMMAEWEAAAADAGYDPVAEGEAAAATEALDEAYKPLLDLIGETRLDRETCFILDAWEAEINGEAGFNGGDYDTYAEATK